MKMIEDKTRIGTRNCITFKNRKAEKTFLEIKNGAGCDSKVGKSNHKAPQILNLNRFRCMNEAIIAHELVHALGFDHEHKRPDRDDWVEIDFKNVRDGTSNFDFKKLDLTEFKDLGTPYDYKSIMHYDSYAHAEDNSSHTIKALKSSSAFIEINEILSDIDILEIRKLYNCKPGISNLYFSFIKIKYF